MRLPQVICQAGLAFNMIALYRTTPPKARPTMRITIDPVLVIPDMPEPSIMSPILPKLLMNTRGIKAPKRMKTPATRDRTKGTASVIYGEEGKHGSWLAGENALLVIELLTLGPADLCKTFARPVQANFGRPHGAAHHFGHLGQR